MCCWLLQELLWCPTQKAKAQLRGDVSVVCNPIPILICFLALIQYLHQDSLMRTWSAVAEPEKFASCSQWFAVLALHWVRFQLDLG